MEWRLWPPGSGSEARPWSWMSPGPGLRGCPLALLFPHTYSLHPPLSALRITAVPPMVCAAWWPLRTTRSPRASLGSLDPSLCVFNPKTPSESICLAGQTLGSGPCSRARLLTAALGQGSKSGLPSCGQSPGVHGGGGPQRGGAGPAHVGGAWQAGSSQ